MLAVYAYSRFVNWQMETVRTKLDSKCEDDFKNVQSEIIRSPVGSIHGLNYGKRLIISSPKSKRIHSKVELEEPEGNMNSMLDHIWLTLNQCAEEVEEVRNLAQLQQSNDNKDVIIERMKLELKSMKTELEQCWKKIGYLEAGSRCQNLISSQISEDDNETRDTSEEKELMTKMHSSNAKNHNPSSHHKNRNNAHKNPQPHFPWILIIFVSLTALAGLVMYDITTKGSFKASKTRQILNDWGISSVCDTTWKFVRLHSINIYRWCETNVPLYYKTATEFCAPYVIPAKVKCYELGIGFLEILSALGANFAEIISPILTWVDINVPPFLKTVGEYLLEIFTYAVVIATPIVNATIDMMHNSYRWVMENVFVGQLDPQNLQRNAISAVDAVQEYTVNLLKWLSQQVFTN